MTHLKTMMPCCVALALSFAAGGASAVEKLRIVASGPTNYCQAALPVFDGNIRKRPLAVQNEGTSNAFVTCSFPTQLFTGDGEVEKIEVFVSNSNDTDTDITCTAVGGFQGQGADLQFDMRTTTLNGGESVAFSYHNFQYRFDLFPSPFSVSCNLKPGMAILESYVYMTEDVGA